MKRRTQACGKFRGSANERNAATGLAAHGGNVTKSAGQTTMSHNLGRVPIATKMNAFERKVGGDQNLMPRGNPQDRAIVANANSHAVPV